MRHHSIPRKQTGSTLIVSLVILIILMLLGVTAVMTSNTQYKMAGNLQFEDAALNNAEGAISAAETWLAAGANYRVAGLVSDACNGRSVAHLYPLDTSVTPPTPCLNGYAAPANDTLAMTWSDGNSIQAGSASQRYIIELMSTNSILVGSSAALGGRVSAGCNKANTYRITARGTSARGATKFVQSYYSVLSCS